MDWWKSWSFEKILDIKSKIAIKTYVRNLNRPNISFFIITMLTSLCLTGCQNNQHQYSNICYKENKVNEKQALNTYQSDKALSKKVRLEIKKRRQVSKLNCKCISRGFTTILTPHEYDEMIDAIKKKPTSPITRRDSYLKSIGKKGKGDGSYYSIQIPCAKYVRTRLHLGKDTPSPFW